MGYWLAKQSLLPCCSFNTGDNKPSLVNHQPFMIAVYQWWWYGSIMWAEVVEYFLKVIVVARNPRKTSDIAGATHEPKTAELFIPMSSNYQPIYISFCIYLSKDPFIWLPFNPQFFGPFTIPICLPLSMFLLVFLYHQAMYFLPTDRPSARVRTHYIILYPNVSIHSSTHLSSV